MQVECMSHTDEGCSAMTNEVYYPKRADGKKVSGFHNTYKKDALGRSVPRSSN